MLAALSDLLKQGVIGRLEAVNLEQRPEVGQTLGVRSVPWLRMGRIELAGVHSKTELAEWAAKADSEAGIADWFHLLLKEGQLPRAQAMIEAEPELLAAVLPMLSPERGAQAADILQAVILLFSGVYYRLEALPEWMQAASSVSPATYTLRAVRAALLEGAGWDRILPDLLTVLLIGVVLVPVGAIAFAVTERWAKKTGKLKRSG